MIRQCPWFLSGFVQTLIQLATFSFTPTGARVWCTGCGVDLQLLQAVPFFLNMLNSDDKTVSNFARTSLFLDMRRLEVLAQQRKPGFLKLWTKSKPRCQKLHTESAGCVRFSQTDLTSVTSVGGTSVLLWTEQGLNLIFFFCFNNLLPLLNTDNAQIESHLHALLAFLIIYNNEKEGLLFENVHFELIQYQQYNTFTG